MWAVNCFEREGLTHVRLPRVGRMAEKVAKRATAGPSKAEHCDWLPARTRASSTGARYLRTARDEIAQRHVDRVGCFRGDEGACDDARRRVITDYTANRAADRNRSAQISGLTSEGRRSARSRAAPEFG
jgi:hypothetical protein